MGRDIRYASSDGVQIAYEVFGSGPRDLVFVHGRVGIEFSRGTRELKGVPGRWELYAAS